MPRPRANALLSAPPSGSVLTGATKEFRKQPIVFMRTYTIVPPSDRELRQFTYQQNGHNMVGYDPGFKTTGDIGTDGTFSRFFDQDKIVDQNRMVTGTFKRADVTTPIGHMQLEPHRSYPGAYTFQVKNDEGPTRLPIWFLPWASDRIVQMTIPERPRNTPDNDPRSPDIFFTAAINGCSVFVTGNSRAPTVAHLGTENSTPYGGDAAKFWRALFAVSEMQYSGHSVPIGGEVNNTMYVNDTGISKELHTVNADAYKRFLEGLPGPGVKVKQVQPYGCVFGIRFGRLWSFYLQENARVTTVRVGTERKTVTLRRGELRQRFWGIQKKIREITEEVDVQVEVESVVNKPMRVSPFYPQGHGSQTFTTTFLPV